MTRHIVKILLALSLAVIAYSIGMPGCSPTQFGTLKTLTCEDFPDSYQCRSNPRFPDQDSQPEPEPEPTADRSNRPNRSNRRNRPDPRPPRRNYLDFDYEISLGKVDIIFVIDNSSSMAVEHRSLGQQFRSFLNQIRDVQYHIAVITTDISSSPENPVRGAYYQDGKFIPINGRLFLRNENLGGNPPHSAVAGFASAITREETTRCDRGDQPVSRNRYDRLYEGDRETAGCPSHDERGTYAMNLAIHNYKNTDFFREKAHLMFVVLSDEDIRSSADYINQPGFEHYNLENLDYPETLVRNVRDSFGPLKSFSVHSIIIPPGDSSCLEEQNRRRDGGQGTGRGYYGEQYTRLSRARENELTQYGNLLKGNVISICSRSYGAQLQRVAVSAETIRMELPCSNPKDVEFYIDGQKIRKSYTIEGRTLIMEPGTIPLGSQVRLKMTCEE